MLFPFKITCLSISIFIAIGLLDMLYPTLVKGQDQIMGPSTHTTDVKSLFANPALISFQRPKFGTGIQAYHLGLLEEGGVPLTQGFATISSPVILGNSLGAGVNIQYFNSPIYKRTHFGASASMRLFRYVSIGGQVSGLNISYNQDNFDLVNPNDPVFMGGTGKTVLNTSLGIFTQPADFFGLSLGVRNLNEPNISLIGDDVKEPRVFFGGLSLVQGPFRGSLEIIQGRNNLDGMLFLELYSVTGNYVRASSNHNLDQGILEGQLHVAGPLSVNYQYTLPLTSVLGPSWGSHMFSLIFEFSRRRSLPAKVAPPRHRASFDRPDFSVNMESRVYLSSDTDYLKVFEKNITRHIDPGLSDQALANVSMYDLGVLDSSFVAEDISYPTETVLPIPEQVEFQDLISPEYNRFIQSIGRDYERRVSVISEREHIMRAAAIHNKILSERQAASDMVNVETPVFQSAADSLLFRTPAQRHQIIGYEEITLLEPEELKLSLHAVNMNIPVQSWQLTIRDYNEELIHTINGNSDIPSELKWNWRDNTGEVIEPGIYTYQLSWRAEDGSLRFSNQRKLYVQKTQRNITIRVSDDLNKMPERPDQIRILIKH